MVILSYFSPLSAMRAKNSSVDIITTPFARCSKLKLKMEDFTYHFNNKNPLPNRLREADDLD